MLKCSFSFKSGLKLSIVQTLPPPPPPPTPFPPPFLPLLNPSLLCLTKMNNLLLAAISRIGQQAMSSLPYYSATFTYLHMRVLTVCVAIYATFCSQCQFLLLSLLQRRHRSGFLVVCLVSRLRLKNKTFSTCHLFSIVGLSPPHQWNNEFNSIVCCIGGST